MSERPVKDKNGDLITDEEDKRRDWSIISKSFFTDLLLSTHQRYRQLVKSLESSLKEKEHEVKQEQQRNRELDAKFKNLLQEKESIEAQLQKILDNHYTEKSELSSKIKSLQEEKKKTQRCKNLWKKAIVLLITQIPTRKSSCDKKNQENNEPTKVKEQNKQCEHLSDSDSTEIDLDSSIFLQEDVGLQPIDHEQPSSHSVKKVQDQKNKRYLEKAQARSEENLRNTSNEVSNIKSRLIDVEHEKIMLVKQLTQFRSKYKYITRQKDKEIQRLKSELERVQITTCGLFFALSLHDTFHVRTKNPLLALNFYKLNRASHLNLIYSSYIVLWYSMYFNV
ncbi:M protein, serotype 24-like [Biomphalaria glabrata]|uniref:M protein, serotype 24-like n=1 Tax=Biomphalaria glabrata TaxID=6526 RepID=A0A9W2YF56_BIOGL|nr:M protein, serotype 24-like [Biomphalaria glabrata]